MWKSLFFWNGHSCDLSWSLFGVFFCLPLSFKLSVIVSCLVSNIFSILINFFLFLLFLLLFSKNKNFLRNLIIWIILWELVLKVIHSKLCFWVDFNILIKLQKSTCISKKTFETCYLIISTCTIS